MPSLPATSSPPIHSDDPVPATSTTIATPNDAPAVMPRTNGSASGLRKIVCICAPHSAEGGAGEAGGDRALAGAPCARCRARRRWPARAAAGRRRPRPATRRTDPSANDGDDGDEQQPGERREDDDLRRGGARRRCGDGDYDGGTSLRNTNSWSGTRSGWSTAT